MRPLDDGATGAPLSKAPESAYSLQPLTRGFLTARYMLGHREPELTGAAQLSNETECRTVTILARRLTRGTREERVHVLAGEVHHLLRSLSAQRIR